jgi:Flp pilus assembly protein TadD
MTASSTAQDLYHEGLDRLAEGDTAGAVQRLRHCLEVDPGMLDAMHGLIRALQDSGEFDAAIAVAHRLLQLDPEEVLAHTSLSILYQHKGMIAEAEAEALKAKLLGWKKQLRQQKPQQ